MRCPECGRTLPEGSVFCQYCGARLGERRAETLPKRDAGSARSPAARPAPPPAASPKPAPPPVSPAPPRQNTGAGRAVHCRLCGGIIDPETKKCTVCGKQYFRAKTVLPVTILALLLALSIGINAVQWSRGSDAGAVVKAAEEDKAAQTAQLQQLEQRLIMLENLVSILKGRISALEDGMAP